jgi:formylglycine-generating enzyme required for sulfatase activity
MLPEKYQWIDAEFEPEGDAGLLFEIARGLEDEGNLEAAATVYDRAYGLAPGSEEIVHRRARLLDRLAVFEHGLVFRYVPGGVFLMGDNAGEADERPWHPVWLSPYWLAETPVSWAAYCRLKGWQAPPAGLPADYNWQEVDCEANRYCAAAINKIRLQYCEDQTSQAVEWHAHIPDLPAEHRTTFGTPPRDAATEWAYDTKPMVGVAWEQAADLGERLSSGGVRYGLPTEAQWEKAARGGLIGARHAWGNQPPSPERCDFNRFREFSIQPMRTFPPNGYGLYAMNGCVWEWVRDWYDRDYYREAPERDPEGPPHGKERVLRGGCWADCAEVVTVTFRMARVGGVRGPGSRGGEHATPTLGFRLCRTVTPGPG